MAKKMKASKQVKPVKQVTKTPAYYPEGGNDEGGDIEAVNRLATSVPDPVPVPEADAHKVRADDLKRSVEQMVELAPHSDEAVMAAGLPLEGYDKRKVALIAAVPAPGASGKVGWVTARMIWDVLTADKGK